MVGVIRLGCFHSIAPFYLPQIISAYKNSFPNIEIASSELRQDEIISGIGAGEKKTNIEEYYGKK